MFNAKLAGWKNPYLTRAGKIALINSVLSSLPVYFMSLFDMPKSVELKLERIMRNFLWNDIKGHRKLHLVKWDVICRRKRNGGLGVKKLRIMNYALLVKWLWRFANESEALWRRIVEEKYGTDGLDWLSKQPKGTYGVSVWRGIMQRKEFFLQNFKFKVNNGHKTRFWEDRWLLDDPLCNVFPHLYAASRFKSQSVATVCSGTLSDLFENLKLPRRLSVEANGEFDIIHESLTNFSLNPNREDIFQWALTTKKIFSVKSCYNKILATVEAPGEDIFQFLWQQKYPPKVAFFIWCLSHFRFPTRDSLIRKGIATPSTCLFCNNDETSSHLFLQCEFVVGIWQHFMGKLNVCFTMPPTVPAALLAWQLNFETVQKKLLWNLLAAAILWCTWKERNARVFTNKAHNKARVIHMVKYSLFEWALAIKEFEDVSFRTIFWALL